MIALHGYRLYWRERRAHADTRAAYDNLVIAHQRALVQVAGLERDLDAALQQGECLACDVADLERVNAALVQGIEWNDGMAR